MQSALAVVNLKMIVGLGKLGACLEAPQESAAQQAFARIGRALRQIGYCGLRQPAASPEPPSPAEPNLTESMPLPE